MKACLIRSYLFLFRSLFAKLSACNSVFFNPNIRSCFILKQGSDMLNKQLFKNSSVSKGMFNYMNWAIKRWKASFFVFYFTTSVLFTMKEAKCLRCQTIVSTFHLHVWGDILKKLPAFSFWVEKYKLLLCYKTQTVKSK